MIRIIDDEEDYITNNDEAELFLNNKKLTWDKNNYIANINNLHENLFKSILEQYNYLSMAELLLWSKINDSEHYREANAIINWYVNSYNIIQEYCKDVTEESALPIQDFIKNLPLLTI